MAFSIFGKKKDSSEQAPPHRFVRPMQKQDISAVVAIIDQHDEDDASEAQDDFAQDVEGMFVAIDGDRLVGVTGAVQDPEVDSVCWLSWTYVDEQMRGQGMGRYLVDGLLTQLQNAGIRKVFIPTGDYREDGRDIYAGAKAFYEKLGAELELIIKDYHSLGEARYIYGLDISRQRQEGSEKQDGSGQQESGGRDNEVRQNGYLVFDGLVEARESDGAVNLTWHEYGPQDEGANPREQLQELIDKARAQGARLVIAAVPADLGKGAVKGLAQADFTSIGELKDYYGEGVDQLNWGLVLYTDGAK